MPEGTYCNKKPVNTPEEVNFLLSDSSGTKYYEEMKLLDVDSDLLASTIEKTMKSRLKTWLEICAHCGMCADSCFLYQVNNRDPRQVPAYKIQSTLGEIVKRKGKVSNEFMRHAMEVAGPSAPAATDAACIAPTELIPASCSDICGDCSTSRDSSPGN